MNPILFGFAYNLFSNEALYFDGFSLCLEREIMDTEEKISLLREEGESIECLQKEYYYSKRNI